MKKDPRKLNFNLTRKFLQKIVWPLFLTVESIVQYYCAQSIVRRVDQALVQGLFAKKLLPNSVSTKFS
jgi:hypothetical protein